MGIAYYEDAKGILNHQEAAKLNISSKYTMVL